MINSYAIHTLFIDSVIVDFSRSGFDQTFIRRHSLIMINIYILSTVNTLYTFYHMQLTKIVASFSSLVSTQMK